MAPRRSERVAQRAKTALSKRQNLERKSEADKVLTRPVKSKVDKRKGKKAELKITLARFPNLVPNKPKEKENNDKGVESGVRAGPRQRKTGGGRAVSTLKAASNAKEKEVQSAEESGSESDMEDEESDYDEDEQAEETADHTKKVASKTRAQQRKSTQTTKKPNQPKKSTVTRTNKSTAPAKETKSIKGQAAKEAAQTRKQAASAAKAAAVNAKQEVKKAAKERFDAALKQVRDFTGPIRSDADRKRPIIFRGVHKDRRRRVISNGDPYYDNTLGLMAQWWARDTFPQG
ncbi:hypothetical protein M011DRAFT_526365 [Sporormia fimetaria CBS 119925]|uniref:Uncharacterized protein n=1 Tax=Sporormia fimetaria CBS 119925 TaxID=1340428 RepID=A0A6A6VBS9_9PLEO|nr:hypothetical protein M011DRAFT_526365 [Sporormia fimetaria CBS 119925]